MQESTFFTPLSGKNRQLKMPRRRPQGPARRLALAGLALLCLPLPGAPVAAQALTDFHLDWVWTVPGNDIGAAGLEVVDLDGDGRSEILATAEAGETSGYWYTLERRGSELVQTYSSLPFEGGVVAVSVAHEGGQSRIVVTGTNSIKLFDGATRRELATFPTLAHHNIASALADLGGDGTLDLVVCDIADLYVYELLTGTARVKYGFGCNEIVVGQTDDDPQLEIALAGNNAGGFVLDGDSLTVDWADVRGFGSHVALGDFDNDGRDEVASLIQYDGGVRVQDPESGALLWELSMPEVVDLAAANLDAEPGDELVWVVGQWGSLYVVDGATPAELSIITNPTSYPQALALGDADDDGVADVLWSAGRYSSLGERLYLAPSNATEYEATSSDLLGPFPGIAVGDFLGDGSREVGTAAAGTQPSRGGVAMVFTFGEGRLLRSSPLPFPGTSPDYLTSFSSGQLDNDAQLEICLSGNAVVGCLDGATFAEQWRVGLPDSISALRGAEIDGDPFPELLVGAYESHVYALEGESGWLAWRTPDMGQSAGVKQIELANLEGDSFPEVVSGSAAWGGDWITSFSGDSGLVSAGPWVAPFTSMLSLPGSGLPELMLIAKDDGTIVTFDPLTGSEGAQVASFPEPVKSFRLADMNRDGVLDLVAALEHHIWVLDGQNGLPLWVSPYLVLAYNATESLLVGDLDNNSVAEILVSTQYGLVKFGAPMDALFADGFESGDTSNW